MPVTRTRKRLAAAGLLLSGLLVSAGAPAGAQSEPPPPDAAAEAAAGAGLGRTNQIVVRMAARDTVTDQELADLSETAADPLGGERLEFVRKMDDGALVLRVPQFRPGAEMAMAAALLQARADVALAEPDLLATPALVPNDPEFPNLWSLSSPATGPRGINAPAAWDITTGDPNLVTAVLDTGQTNHPDLGNQIAGYDMISDSRVGNDGNGRDANSADTGDWITSAESASGFFVGCTVSNSSWHGTHVAGTIGATANNNAGIVGINWRSKIQHVRVLGKCGGYFSDIADGVRWAAGLSVSGTPLNPTPARVINMSLGGSGACPSTMQNALNAATNAGAIVVVAAGNSNANASGFTPANCANVITVAATGKAGSRAYYSNFGSVVEIAAPGGDRIADSGDTILSTLNSGTRGPASPTLARYQGTSMATPHVAGVVSLVLSVNPSLTLSQVTSLLQTTATPFPGGSSCTTTLCGRGIVNAQGAVAAASGGGGGPGSFRKTAPANNAVRVGLRPTLKWTASAGATAYEYCVDTINNGQCDTTWVRLGRVRQVRVPAALPRRTPHYWQVRAIKGTGVTPADGGTTFTFTTR